VRADLNFHQTFAPEREYLGRLLELACGMRPMTKEEIFQETGIPTGMTSGKVEPHIQYAVFMGLVTDRVQNGAHVLERTDLGRIVYEADPHLLEPLTLLVCHHNISSPRKGAALWQFVFQKLIPTLGLAIDQNTLASAASVEFGTPKVNLTPLKTCYTAQKSFGNLGLLAVSGSRTWTFKPVPYRSEHRYAYAYTLLKTWEESLADRKEITLDELVGCFHWHRPFLWDERAMMNVLESLSDLGVLSLNKQLTPITIIRRSTAASALAKLYSRLI